MGYSFEDEKMLWQGKRRDFVRSKLAEGKRIRAKDEANEIYNQTKEMDEKRKRNIRRKQIYDTKDGAMETVLKSIKEDKSIKRLIF